MQSFFILLLTRGLTGNLTSYHSGGLWAASEWEEIDNPYPGFLKAKLQPWKLITLQLHKEQPSKALIPYILSCLSFAKRYTVTSICSYTVFKLCKTSCLIISLCCRLMLVQHTGLKMLKPTDHSDVLPTSLELSFNYLCFLKVNINTHFKEKCCPIYLQIVG